MGNPADGVVALWNLQRNINVNIPFTTDDTWRQVQLCLDGDRLLGASWNAGDVARCELYAWNLNWIAFDAAVFV